MKNRGLISKIMRRNPSKITEENLTSISTEIYHPLELLHLSKEFIKIDDDIDYLQSSVENLDHEGSGRLTNEENM